MKQEFSMSRRRAYRAFHDEVAEIKNEVGKADLEIEADRVLSEKEVGCFLKDAFATGRGLELPAVLESLGAKIVPSGIIFPVSPSRNNPSLKKTLTATLMSLGLLFAPQTSDYQQQTQYPQNIY
jgi:hypothetical protein